MPKEASASEAYALFPATTLHNALAVNDAKITCAVKSAIRTRTVKPERSVSRVPVTQDAALIQIVKTLKFVFRTSVAAAQDLIQAQLDVVTLTNVISDLVIARPYVRIHQAHTSVPVQSECSETLSKVDAHLLMNVTRTLNVRTLSLASADQMESVNVWIPVPNS